MINNKPLVLLFEKFGNSIAGRESIRLIFRTNLKNTNCFTIDFSDIQFISRSAAHELITSLSKHSEVKVINAKGEVKKMLTAVETSLSKPRKERKQLKTLRFNNLTDFRNFLAT